MEDGLANRMVYGDGSSNTITHKYGGTINKDKKMACKKKKKGKKRK